MNNFIGLCDMVLSLSQDKINKEFTLLHRENTIQKRWGLISNATGEKSVSFSKDPAVFSQILKSWEKCSSAAFLEEMQGLKTQEQAVKTVQNQAIDDDDFGKVKTCKEELKVISGQIADLEQEFNTVLQYHTLMDAQIQAPKIQLLPNDPKHVLLIIPFTSGKLCGRMDKEYRNFEAKGLQYAFKVSISKIKVTENEMFLEDTQKTMLREGGFTSADFLIESLFLNFENADISQFVAEYSQLPADAMAQKVIQDAISNYFVRLKGSANPFILGYAVSKPKLKLSENALLQPTAVTYSCSFDADPEKASVNFLMNLSGAEFSGDSRLGVMPHPLLSYKSAPLSQVKDKTNAIMAVDFARFDEIYLKKVRNELVGNFEHYFRNANCGYQGAKEEQDGVVFTMDKEDVRTSIVLGHREISQSDREIRLKFQLSVSGNQHFEKKRAIGTIGMDRAFSTDGQYEINSRKGEKGFVEVILMATQAGKIDVQVNYQQPFIGWVNEKPQSSGFWDGLWDGLNKWWPPLIVFNFAKELFSDKFSAIALNQDDLGKLNLGQLSNVKATIILPGSEVFTFKNIRIHHNGTEQDKTVLFDATYAPVEAI